MRIKGEEERLDREDRRLHRHGMRLLAVLLLLKMALYEFTEICHLLLKLWALAFSNEHAFMEAMPASPSAVVEETKPQSQVAAPKYTETETVYLGGLAQRIERAREQREQKHPLLDGMTYSESGERASVARKPSPKRGSELDQADRHPSLRREDLGGPGAGHA